MKFSLVYLKVTLGLKRKKVRKIMNDEVESIKKFCYKIK